jgi:hypothetical protein
MDETKDSIQLGGFVTGWLEVEITAERGFLGFAEVKQRGLVYANMKELCLGRTDLSLE